MRKNFGVKPWFYPLPVLIVATYDENGAPDAMNAAWGGLYDSDLVELCLSESHKTIPVFPCFFARFRSNFTDTCPIVPAPGIKSRAIPKNCPAENII